MFTIYDKRSFWEVLKNPRGYINLLHWYASLHNSPLMQLLNIVIIVSLIIFEILIHHSFFSLIFVSSILLHEIFHAFVPWIKGIKVKILVFFPLAMMLLPITKEENEKHDNMGAKWLFLAIILGPLANFIILALATILDNYWGDFFDIFNLAIYINGILLISNLVPLFNTDACIIYKILFAGSRYEIKLISAFQAILLFALMCLVVFNPKAYTNPWLFAGEVILRWVFTISTLFMIIGLGLIFAKNDKAGITAPLKLNNLEALLIHSIFLTLYLSSLLIFYVN